MLINVQSPLLEDRALFLWGDNRPLNCRTLMAKMGRLVPVVKSRSRPGADTQLRLTSNPDTMLVKLPEKLMTDFVNIVEWELITQKIGEKLKTLKIIEDKLSIALVL